MPRALRSPPSRNAAAVYRTARMLRGLERAKGRGDERRLRGHQRTSESTTKVAGLLGVDPGI